MPKAEISYSATIKAAYLGYVVQAVVNNFLPLLFVRLQTEFQIPLERITLLITFNFGLQLLIDLFSTPLIERAGYRASMLFANLSVIAGLILLTLLPQRMDPFSGILIAVCVYAIGGGLMEVLVSPIVEACPGGHKEARMSLLHSAYCWGHMSVVLVSTLFFLMAGIGHWRLMAYAWCLVPVLDFLLFTRVPIAGLEAPSGEKTGWRDLCSQKIFWLMMIMMVCAGASEQAISQWSSAFAEKGLGISKVMGDLLGPMFFALMMGISRTIYGLRGHRIDLEAFMTRSVCLCLASYLMISLVPYPPLALLACGISGFSVGIFWPGTFSTATQKVKGRGTLMFALLALAGDLGCSGGPTVAGMVAGAMGENMRAGIGAALIFPLGMGLGLILLKYGKKRR